jgi:hypothetical protein
MEQPNCLSGTPFFHCIFVVLSRVAYAYPALAVDLSTKDPSAHNYPWRKHTYCSPPGCFGTSHR